MVLRLKAKTVVCDMSPLRVLWKLNEFVKAPLETKYNFECKINASELNEQCDGFFQEAPELP